MTRQVDQRHGRSDDELRAQREEDRRLWDAQRRGQSQTDSHTIDAVEMTMAKRQRRPNNIIAMPISEPVVGVIESDVAGRAYELYQQRGGEHGHDVDDWLQAEAELCPSVRSGAA
jgi:hypothetical protein